MLNFEVKESEELKNEKELRRQREEAVRKNEEARQEMIRKRLENEEELRRQGEEAVRREEEARKEMMRKKIEKARQDLQTAIDSRDVRALRAVIREVENLSFIFAFTSEEIEAAKRLVKSLERIEALKGAPLKLDQKTMLELKNYSDPPKLVHRVMKAALLLLGDELTLTTEWSDCQKRLVTIGKHGLFIRLRALDVTGITQEGASQVLNLIGRYQREKVAFVSTGAEAFYSWTMGMIEEFRIANPSVV